MNESGIIFDIQRFSVHDGPGIRTTVFIKGCPLSCAWCSNPESQSPVPQLIARDIKCRGCGNCVQACPQKAVSMADGGSRVINWEMCDNCLKCVPGCLYHSLNIAGRTVSVNDVVKEALRDNAFYRRSGGGVTVSGGEPLNQPEFTAGLCRALKQAGLHVALDTSGCAASDRLITLLPWLDLVLYDIKHLDSGLHEKYTGAGNDLIQSNLRMLTGRVRLWLRVPLIAGFNDSPDHTEKIIALAMEVGAEKISFLPYHEGGRSKCSQIGKNYDMQGAGAPAGERLALLQDMVTQAGLMCGIGN